MMRTKNIGFKQCLELIRSKRPIVNPNYGFQNELSKYEVALKKGSKTVNDIKIDSFKMEKKGDNLSKTQAEKEKNVVINFLNDDKKQNNRFNYTIGGSKDYKP